MAIKNLGRVVGEDGRGIKGIAKTSTNGLVDTYTITYTDNTTSTYTVTNGKDGADGSDGTGSGGTTYPIYFGTETPKTDGSVLLWINTDYEEPDNGGDSGDNENTGNSEEITPFTEVGTVENTLTLNSDGVSYDFTMKSTGTVYGTTGFKRGSSYVTSYETPCQHTTINCLAYNPNASEEGDLVTFLVYWSNNDPMGFVIPVRGTTQGQEKLDDTTLVVEGSGVTNQEKCKVTSEISGDNIVVKIYNSTTNELELTLTAVGLASRGFVPCVGFGVNANGTRTFKNIKF